MEIEVAQGIESTALMMWSSNVIRGEHPRGLMLYESFLHSPQIARTGVCASAEARVHTIDVVARSQLCVQHFDTAINGVQYLLTLIKSRYCAESV